MSQSTYNLAAAQNGVDYTDDINEILASSVTLNSGATAPATTFPYMWWADTTTGILKQRNQANTAWLDRWVLSEGRLATIDSLQATGLSVSALTAVSDLNTITTAGHVVTSDATLNKPTATGIYTVTTLAGNATTASTQTAVNTQIAGDVWTRQKTTNVWGAWRQLSDRQYALGDSIRGNAPTWTSTTSITMGAGLQCLDSTRTTIISVSGTQVINFATTGLNGLDTGAIAANNWYYIHAILNPTTGATGYVASLSQTSPTLPSGFTIRRQLPLALKTKTGSAVLMRFSVMEWGMSPKVRWIDAWDTYWITTPQDAQSTMDDTYVLFGGTASTFTDVSLANFIPSFSRKADLHIALNSTDAVNRFLRLRTKGADSNALGQTFWRNGSLYIGLWKATVDTDVSRLIQYATNISSNVGVQVYYVTEVVG